MPSGRAGPGGTRVGRLTPAWARRAHTPSASGRAPWSSQGEIRCRTFAGKSAQEPRPRGKKRRSGQASGGPPGSSGAGSAIVGRRGQASTALPEPPLGVSWPHRTGTGLRARSCSLAEAAPKKAEGAEQSATGFPAASSARGHRGQQALPDTRGDPDGRLVLANGGRGPVGGSKELRRQG